MSLPGPERVHVSHYTDVKPCHGPIGEGATYIPAPGSGDWGHWDDLPVTRRKLVGRSLDIETFRDGGGQGGVSLRAWLDHYQSGTKVWGLRFTQQSSRVPLPGRTAYIAAALGVTVPWQARGDAGFTEDGDYLLNSEDVSPPIGPAHAHHYWLPNNTVGSLIPEPYSIPGMASLPGSFFRYTFDSAWEVVWSRLVESNWLNLPGYAGPATLASPDDLRANLVLQTGWHQVKPAVRDQDFNVPEYPPPYFDQTNYYVPE